MERKSVYVGIGLEGLEPSLKYATYLHAVSAHTNKEEYVHGKGSLSCLK
jgi:hypothetical protein